MGTVRQYEIKFTAKELGKSFKLGIAIRRMQFF